MKKIIRDRYEAPNQSETTNQTALETENGPVISPSKEQQLPADSILPIDVYDTRNNRFKSANPTTPHVYLKPLPYLHLVKTGNHRKIPKREFEDCPFPTGPAFLNRITQIYGFSLRSRYHFLCEFEFHNVRLWIDYEIVKKLEPNYVWVDFVRSLYIFHFYTYLKVRRKFAMKGLIDEIDRYICDDLKQMYQIGSTEIIQRAQP